jgi:hypothetical protein
MTAVVAATGLASLCLAGSSSTQPAPTSRPTTRPAASDTIRVILTEMEQMGDKVQDLRCSVEYTVEDLIGLSEFTKFGRILYKRTEPNPHFLISFHKTHEGGIVNRSKEWFVFSDRWLFEAKEAGGTIIKREVLREGEKVDLFSLEDSPFPIPFGQRRDEILRHFSVALKPPHQTDPPGCDHLVCIPRPGSRLAETYSRMEFFVSKKLHLPVKIIAVEADPDGHPAKVIVAVFPDLANRSINAGVAIDDFKLPPETRKYQLITEPLDPPANAKP